MDGQPLQFVTEFRYLGHIISNTLDDDSDICREIRNMYTRTNMLICRLNNCSTVVKIRLFRSYCICVYGAGIWSRYCKGSLHKLKICYNRCIKMFFGYSKMHSVTAILFDLGLPSFETLMHNYRYSYREQWFTSLNAAIVFHRNIGSIYHGLYGSTSCCISHGPCQWAVSYTHLTLPTKRIV